MIPFKELGLDQSLLKAVEALGFTEPSEIQEKVIPLVLGAETDLVALAQTGTGKTAAFGLPLLQKIFPESRKTQAVIIAPTRELCLQLTKEMKAYSKFISGVNIVAVYGGASITEQARKIRSGAQIIVATPGRLKDMIGRGIVDLSAITYCILDEADEMLNMGFYEDIKAILSFTPNDKSTWLFSATMPKEVAQIAKKFMHSPEHITVGERNTGVDTVRHEFYVVGGRDRYPALRRLADANPDIFSVIFCRTKRDTQKIAEKLIDDGYNAGALHGDLSQNQRDLVMNSFRKKQLQLLVATDVAARGIDVDDVTHVINYQLPDDIETYTHRSGRTGRAGKSGVSMVIVTRGELRKIREIEKKIKQEFVSKKIPTGMEICEIQLYHLANRIKDTEVSEAISPYLPAIHDVLEGIDRELLIKKMVAVEFSRFNSYYQKSKELNTVSTDFREEKEQKGSSTRYFINIGERDGFDWQSLKDLLRNTTGLERDDIYKVDVKGSFSFFNTDKALQGLMMEHFANMDLEGRAIKLEISEKPSRGNAKFKGKRRSQKSKNHRKGDSFNHKGKKKGGKSRRKGYI